MTIYKVECNYYFDCFKPLSWLFDSYEEAVKQADWMMKSDKKAVTSVWRLKTNESGCFATEEPVYCCGVNLETTN